MDVREEIQAATGSEIRDISPLGGGCIGQVYRVQLDDGQTVVVKFDEGLDPTLHIEGKMLTYLQEHSRLPVPTVYHSVAHLLIMEYLPGDSQITAAAQTHAAELLAALHQVSADAYGFSWPTLIGRWHQPNPWTESWLDFFRKHRLLYMAQEGVQVGRLPSSFISRLTRLCDRLDEWLSEPERPSLIHGDVWTTNILVHQGRISGFVDPAIYYADPEIELAFSTLFGTFGEPFFRRYQEIRPLAPGFFETRRHIYQLYPLLVHVCHFGGGYVSSVAEKLERFGC